MGKNDKTITKQPFILTYNELAKPSIIQSPFIFQRLEKIFLTW